jgi:hypothetical protein
MSKARKAWIVGVAVVLGFTVASPVTAEPHGGHAEQFRGWHEPERWEHHDGPPRGDAWRLHDDARLAGWRAGRWFHGDHLGRVGWWWIVGDEWFFYPAAVYPYPDPYVPPAVAQAPSAAWYYCRSQNAYYPYITTCPEGWQPVQPTP